MPNFREVLFLEKNKHCLEQNEGTFDRMESFFVCSSQGCKFQTVFHSMVAESC